MALGGNIVNRIITVRDIVEVANYLERAREHYQRLIDEDKAKNEGLKFTEQHYEYRTSVDPKVEYYITLSDNRTYCQTEYEWFMQNLELPEKITKIEMRFSVYFSSKEEGFKHNSFAIMFKTNSATIHAYSNKLELEINRMLDDIMDLLNNTPERYDKTIKSRNMRIQAFCISVGIILSYILFIVLKFFVEIPKEFQEILANKNLLIFGQWIIAIVIGNIFGKPVILSWYKKLLPKEKYAGYDKNNRKSIYIDNLEDYTGHCEVLIGEFTNNKKDREKIEEVYSITKIIVLVQLVISVSLYFILK